MELVMGMFGTMLPVENMSLLFDNFVKEKWNFFYKLMISFFKEIQRDML